MSPELLRRAQRETLHTRRLAQRDHYARWPRDYWRAVDPRMRIWLRPAVIARWQARS